MTEPTYSMPSRFYTDPAVYDAEKEKIFYRSWQFAGHVSDLPDPGSFRTLQIADESIVVVRDREGTLRAFYNVCRHRAHRIVEGSGKCRRLVCPYHGWSYNLDGRLHEARGTEDTPGLDLSAIRLTPVRLEVFCGFILVNLDREAPGLEDLYPGLEAEILAAKPSIGEVTRVFEDRIHHQANWKVTVENYSECYHCPVAHKYITSNVYSGEDYRITVGDGIVRHFSPRLKDREKHGDLHIWFLWPNLAIQVQPVHRAVSIRHFRFAGPRETIYDYLWYVDKDLAEEAVEEVREMGRTYRMTNGAEDQRIVKNVQLGLESRSFDRGPLILTPEPRSESENAVAFFQSQYLAAMEAG